MGFATLLLAVDALVLHREDELLGDGVQLGDLLLRQASDDVVSRLVVRGDALLSDLATLVGELHGVGTLAFGVLDGDVAVALGLLHDILELAAVETENLHQLALSGAVVVDERVQQRALAALVAFRAVLVKGEADELAGMPGSWRVLLSYFCLSRATIELAARQRSITHKYSLNNYLSS